MSHTTSSGSVAETSMISQPLTDSILWNFPARIRSHLPKLHSDPLGASSLLLYNNSLASSAINEMLSSFRWWN